MSWENQKAKVNLWSNYSLTKYLRWKKFIFICKTKIINDTLMIINICHEKTIKLDFSWLAEFQMECTTSSFVFFTQRLMDILQCSPTQGGHDDITTISNTININQHTITIFVYVLLPYYCTWKITIIFQVGRGRMTKCYFQK